MKIPSENPRVWLPEAKNLLGEQCTDAIDEGIKIYEAYTLQQIQNNPSLGIQLYRKAQPYIDRAARIGSQNFVSSLFSRADKKVSAKRDPLQALQDLDLLIGATYPEWLGITCSEALLLNPIIGHIKSAALARLAKWRHENNTPEKHEYSFYFLLGTSGHPRASIGTDPAIIMALGSYFQHVRLAEFFKDEKILPKEDEQSLQIAARKRINDFLAQVIATHRQFGVPLSLSEKNDLAQNKLHVQFEDIDPCIPDHAVMTARAIVYNDKDGTTIKNSPNILSSTKPQVIADKFISFSVIVGDSVAFLISRDKGEIHGAQQSAEDIKYMVGEAGYELLRTHLLLQLAELTCPADVLRKELAQVINISGVNSPSKPIHRPRGPRQPPQPKFLPSRYFPRSLLGPPGTPTGATRLLRMHGVTYHPRLLPVGHRPSSTALQLAANHGFTLDTFITEDGQMRYETFVRQHERGIPDPNLTSQNQELAIAANLTREAGKIHKAVDNAIAQTPNPTPQKP